MLSGKFVIRVDPILHKMLKKEALEKGESMNSLCVKKLTQASASEALWSELIQRIQVSLNPLGVVLFGSVARGENTKQSDVDLLIVMRDSESIDRELYSRWDQIFSRQDNYSPQFVHLPKVSLELGSLWLETSLDGKILFDPEGVVAESLQQVRYKIAQGVYLRKESQGHFYWVQNKSKELANAK